MKNYTYHISISDIDRATDTDEFDLILRLGRFLNSLNASLSLAIYAKNNKYPSGKRDTNQAFFMNYALLSEFFYESAHHDSIFQTLKKYSHQEIIKPDVIDSLISAKNDFMDHSSLDNDSLKKFRDKFTFHFDPNLYRKDILPNFQGNEKETFIESHTNKNPDVFYNLSDEVIFHYLFGNINESQFSHEIKLITVFAKQVTEEIDKSILHLLDSLDFELTQENSQNS